MENEDSARFKGMKKMRKEEKEVGKRDNKTVNYSERNPSRMFIASSEEAIMSFITILHHFWRLYCLVGLVHLL